MGGKNKKMLNPQLNPRAFRNSHQVLKPFYDAKNGLHNISKTYGNKSEYRNADH